MLHCTCTIGIKCERKDEMEVQFAINMVSVDVDQADTDDEYTQTLNVICRSCHTSGYLCTNPIMYCGCPKGLYYAGYTEVLFQLMDDTGTFMNDIIPEDEYMSNMMNTLYLQQLPFDTNVVFERDSIECYSRERDYPNGG
jgi:hypothetical protein